MSDDLVKRATTPIEEWCNQALARISALEAALAKALGALGDIGDGETEWPDDPQKELDWCRNRALAAYRQAREATK